MQELGRGDEARAQFERALELKPDLADAYFNLGNLQRQAGRPNEALPYCERAVELQPQSASARSNLGAVFQAMGRISAAREAFETALRLDPRNVEALGNLAVVLINERNAGWTRRSAVAAIARSSLLIRTFVLAVQYTGGTP